MNAVRMICTASVLVLMAGAAWSADPSPCDPKNAKASESGEVKVALTDLPKTVVDAVNTAQPGGKLLEADKETKNGVVVYEVDVSNNGKNWEVRVDAAGKVLSNKIDEEDTEVKVALSDLPKAVVDAVNKAQPGGKLLEADKENKNGVDVFEVDVSNNGKTWEVQVDATGKLISNKIDAEDAQDQKGEVKK